ncbi:MAG: glycoside hydrolase family 127 protein [Bacilli bacterium]|nr:glycoside hydrolase family 127 protein [Bacilli bacterium]
MNYAVNNLGFGDIKLGGYAGMLVSFIVNKQYKDAELWKLLVNQFRVHSDVDCDWRGEYWGKLMRGACLNYQATKDKELYAYLTDTVIDLISVQEKNGRLSTYPLEKEFNGWDMWCRKYAIIGLLEYYEICNKKSLKKAVLKAAKRSADYIIKHIGNGKNKKSILETSRFYGGLNSASICRAFAMLYKASGEEKYLDFAHYIVDTGFCKGFDLVNACFTSAYPFQFPVVKAYEMTSCIESLIDLYELEGNQKYLDAAIRFGKKIEESDFTIIGCAGCAGEMFDNSSLTQTEKPKRNMQETCVTVTLMGFYFKLLRITGDAHYADLIERSAYNALFGAVNNENQTMVNSHGNVWVGDDCFVVPHESYPFDSYSPIYMGSRGSNVGGFKQMENDRSYGCCACNGGRGMAITNLFSVLKKDGGLLLNFYNDMEVKTEVGESRVSIKVSANLYKKNKALIKVKGNGSKWPLSLRVPEWADAVKVSINDIETEVDANKGYMTIDKEWSKDKIVIEFKMPAKSHCLNGKIAFTKGPIVLARDRRLDDIEKPLGKKVRDGSAVRMKPFDNKAFASNSAYEFKCGDNIIHLVDYSQAGKDYDDPSSKITVWQNK